MPNFVVNRNSQPTGEHEVHVDNGTCPKMPFLFNQHPLGYHLTCQSAVEAAKRLFTKVDGCYYCIPACNRG